MKLIIDYREKQIIDKISLQNGTFTWNNVEMNIEVSNLPVADFAFVEKDSDYLILVERKTHTDLESSIIDGRFRQQKDRLINSINDPNKILYIIEGNKVPKQQNMVNCSIVNILYKHQFKVLFSKSPEQTLTFLSIIYKKLQNGDIKINNIDNDNENMYTDNVSNIIPYKLISKADKIKNSLFQCLLSVIPGVSITIANKIVEIYPTLKTLMDEYNKCQNDDEREKLLADINLGARKLGPAISKKIWRTFYFNSV